MIPPRPRVVWLVPLFFLFSFSSFSCAAEPEPLELGWTPDSPAVYRVTATSESRFSGPVSDLSSATDAAAVLRVTPVSADEAEVEVLRFGASVSDSSDRAAEPVALSVPDFTGDTATVRFSPPGVVSEIEGDSRFLDASVPLVSTEDIVRAVFPPLPEGTFSPEDTWTGGIASPFPNLGGEFVRMRYVLDSTGAAPEITGYELSVSPRSFASQTTTDEVTGEGHLDVEFEGTLDEQGGYATSHRRAVFESDFLRLGSGGYANGEIRISQELEVERLNAFEQFGLDAIPE